MLPSTEEALVTRPRRTQATRRKESDRRMLRAAARLFAERGVSGTSLADVGVAAGYSRGLPVERFGTKLGLIVALLDAMDAWFQAHISKVLVGVEGSCRRLGCAWRRIWPASSATRPSTAALYSIYTESLFVMPELQSHVALVTGPLVRWTR